MNVEHGDFFKSLDLIDRLACRVVSNYLKFTLLIIERDWKDEDRTKLIGNHYISL